MKQSTIIIFIICIAYAIRWFDVVWMTYNIDSKNFLILFSIIAIAICILYGLCIALDTLAIQIVALVVSLIPLLYSIFVIIYGYVCSYSYAFDYFVIFLLPQLEFLVFAYILQIRKIVKMIRNEYY